MTTPTGCACSEAVCDTRFRGEGQPCCAACTHEHTLDNVDHAERVGQAFVEAGFADQAKVARDLTEILRIDEELTDQAVNDANATIDGHSLPGGYAMIALAPVARAGSFQRRIDLAEAAWFAAPLEARGPRPALDSDEDDSWEPPIQLLRFWSDHYRIACDADWDHIPTLHTEASFLKHQLDWIFDHETHLPEFARDINRARVRLENLLQEGRRPERSRVVCDRPQCAGHNRQLVRVFQSRWRVGWSCATCNTTMPEERACEICTKGYPASGQRRCDRPARKGETCGGRIVSTAGDHGVCFNPVCPSFEPLEEMYTSDAAGDYWKCPGCKTRYDDVEYAAALAQQLRADERNQRFVLVADAVNMLVAQGNAESTVRRWLRAPRERTADRCVSCRTRWAPAEYAACEKPMRKLDSQGQPIPLIVDGQPVLDDRGDQAYETEPCGGELRPVYTGNGDAVIEGYCDLRTRRTLVWWPDMWSRHRAEYAKRKAREADARRRAELNAEWRARVAAGGKPYPTAEALGIHPRRVKALLDQLDNERLEA